MSSGRDLHENISIVVAGITGFMFIVGPALSATYRIPLIRSAAALLLIGFFVVSAISTRRLRSLTSFHKLSIVLFALLVLGILHTRSPVNGSAKALLVLFYWVVFGVAFFNVFTARRHVVHFMIGMGLGGVAYVLLLWFFEGSPLDILSAANTFFRLVLAGSQNPLSLGRVMGVSMIVLLWFLSDRPIGRFSFLAIPILPLAFGYLVATRSKGPGAGPGVAVGGLGLQRASRWGRVIALGSLSLLVALLIFAMVNADPDHMVHSRLLQTGSASFGRRLDSWRTAFDGFANGTPVEMLMGHGTGDFSYLVRSADVTEYPHNIFLEVLYEVGIVGLAVLIGALAAPLVMLRRFAASDGAIEHPQVRGLIATAVAIYVFAVVTAQVSGNLATNDLIPISGTILITLTRGTNESSGDYS